MTNLYIDCEWFLNQKIFLIGYAYSIHNHNQLYHGTLTLNNLVRIFEPANGYVFFYGPDIAMLEKHFKINIRNQCPCVNLLRVFRMAKPYMSSYKLSYFEYYYDIPRTTLQYKTNIFQMWHDWNDPELKPIILKYNNEDVLNLIRLKKKIFNECSITYSDLNKMLLN